MVLLDLPFTKFKSKPPIPQSTVSFGILHDDKESLGLSAILAKANKNIYIFNEAIANGKSNYPFLEMASLEQSGKHIIKYTPNCLDCQIDIKIPVNELTNVKIHNDLNDFNLVNNLIFSGTKLQQHNFRESFHKVLNKNQAIYILDAPLLSGLEFAQLRKMSGFNEYCPIIEISPLFNHVTVTKDYLSLAGLKELSYIAGTSKNMTRQGISGLSPYPSNLMPASNCLERAFVNMAGIIRPLLLIHFLNLPKAKQDISSDFYANPDLLKLTFELEQELKLILKAYSCSLNALNQKAMTETSSQISYNKSLEATFKTNVIKAAFHGLLGKSNLNIKLSFETIIEDIRLNLVLISQLAYLADVKLNLIPKAILQMSDLSRCDISAQARNLKDVGLDRLNYKEIIEILNQ